jgi:hypothetical protein
MAAVHADSFDGRAAILGRLVLRNRVVAVLRFVIPGLGLAALLVLVGQIWLGSLARQYGVAGIRIDRGDVVVETPQYSGMGSNGSRYLATAKEARTSLLGGNEIDMTAPTLEFLANDGITYFATGATARMNTATETVSVPGPVDVTGSDGLKGLLHDVDVDVRADRMTSNGAASFVMSDGTTIDGETMVRVGDIWTFTNATVVVPQLPEAEEDAPLAEQSVDDVVEQLR